MRYSIYNIKVVYFIFKTKTNVTIEKFISKDTNTKDIMLRAIYIPNTVLWWHGSYFIYYYDLLNHTFYINDLDYICKENRTSAINIIEQIISKIFIQEINFYWPNIKKILIRKVPKVIYYYTQKQTNNTIKDEVVLTPIWDMKYTIKRFKNPVWDSEKSLEIPWDELDKYFEKA